MNQLYDTALMHTALGDNNEFSTYELNTQYEEFRQHLRAVLFDDVGYIEIDTLLNDVLFVLSRAIKDKKKV